MGRYTAIARVRRGIPAQTLVALTNDDPMGSEADETVIEQEIADAEDIADDHLRGRHRLPLKPVPTTLARVVEDIVRHNLYLRRPEIKIPEDVVRIYKESLKTLEAIRDGALTLGDSEQQAQPEPGGYKVRGRGPKITQAMLDQYQQQ